MEKTLAKNISISLTEDLIRSVSEYCSQRGCSRSWFFKKAVEQYLTECLENQQDYEEAVEAWKEGEKTGDYYTSEEVRKELGL